MEASVLHIFPSINACNAFRPTISYLRPFSASCPSRSFLNLIAPRPPSSFSKNRMMMHLKLWELQSLFERFDCNRDGRIDLDELQSMLRVVGMDMGRREMEKVLGVASLDLEGFAAMCEVAESSGNQDGGSEDDGDGERELMEAFRVFDEDGDGFISSKELGRVLARMGLWKEEDGDCMAMISKFDSDADGRLDFQEFKHMMLTSL